MFRNNLRLKVSLYLVLALLPAAVLLPYLIVVHQKERLQLQIASQVTEIAQLIVKSTRYTMLVNQREIEARIVEDIGRQPGIERVRILGSDGTIIHSRRHDEIGRVLSQRDEPCARCHMTSEPLEQVSDSERWRIYTGVDGRRLLAAMEPIRNEPSCANAACHEHPPSTTVLGVVDIAYSLDELDQMVTQHASSIFALSAGTILLVAAGGGLLLQRLIYVPLKDLMAGARRISGGDLDHEIPVRSGDEFGRVAQSFNLMGTALKDSMHELKLLIQTLEQKVEERTAALREAQAEVAQGEKLASIGLLASGIAHELNNPLTGVLTFTSLLRQKMPAGSADAEDLDLVIRETKRCASIIRRLLDFAREKVPTEGPVDLNTVITEVVRFVFNPATLQHIEVETRLAANLPPVWGEADLIKQVVLNIVVNATQAIDGPGKVVIESRTPASATDVVEFAVTDTGRGIPEADLQRIYDPFFTTKEVGKGTGLGLATVYGIVKQHQGWIDVQSELNKGTTF
ncbi:MAG: ATP-binding protein, partial [Rubrivivax sp.]|nr:ATP-binding protein [Rubrivivax sp.]